MNTRRHRSKGPSSQIPISEIERLDAMHAPLWDDLIVRLARHRAAQSPTDRVLLERRAIDNLRRPSIISNPGRRLSKTRERLVHYSHGQAKRGEFGTSRPLRAHERGLTRSGYQMIEERDACPQTERNS